MDALHELAVGVYEFLLASPGRFKLHLVLHLVRGSLAVERWERGNVGLLRWRCV
jgi:hypothetical protein